MTACREFFGFELSSALLLKRVLKKKMKKKVSMIKIIIRDHETTIQERCGDI